MRLRKWCIHVNLYCFPAESSQVAPIPIGWLRVIGSIDGRACGSGMAGVKAGFLTENHRGRQSHRAPPSLVRHGSCALIAYRTISRWLSVALPASVALGEKPSGTPRHATALTMSHGRGYRHFDCGHGPRWVHRWFRSLFTFLATTLRLVRSKQLEPQMHTDSLGCTVAFEGQSLFRWIL